MHRKERALEARDRAFHGRQRKIMQIDWGANETPVRKHTRITPTRLVRPAAARASVSERRKYPADQERSPRPCPDTKAAAALREDYEADEDCQHSRALPSIPVDGASATCRSATCRSATRTRQPADRVLMNELQRSSQRRFQTWYCPRAGQANSVEGRVQRGVSIAIRGN